MADRAASAGGDGDEDAAPDADGGAAPAAPPPAGDGTLSEDALRELFKKTTSTNLRNALATGEWDW